MEPTPGFDNGENMPSQSDPQESLPVTTDFTYTPSWAQDSYVQITDLLFNFGRQTPVKHIADTILNGRYQPGDNVHPLFTALSQSNKNLWRERVVAIWALGRVQLMAAIG